MNETKKKAYRRLLKHLVDSGRGAFYVKKNYNPEAVSFMGDYCYLMHNLVSVVYLDDWDRFLETHFWETFEYLKQKSPNKDRFDNIRIIFLREIESSATE